MKYNLIFIVVKIIYPNGDEYTGETKNGKRNGRGLN
jgi:hypothetical protein